MGTRLHVTALTTAVLLVGLAVSGCLDNEDASACEGETCDTGTTTGDGSSTGPSTSPTPTGGNGPPPGGFNETLRQVRWENCTGMVGDFEVARGPAEDVLPDAFQFEAFTDVTAGGLFELHQCQRVVAGDKVLSDVGYFQIMLRVVPANGSWEEENNESLYVLDLLTTSPDVGATLDRIGAPNKVATLERTEQGTARAWRYTAGDLTVEVEYQWSGDPATTANHDPDHLWAPIETGFVRIDADQYFAPDKVGYVESGVLRMMGPSQASQVLPGSCCVAGFIGQSYESDNEVWTGNATIFR